MESLNKDTDWVAIVNRFFHFSFCDWKACAFHALSRFPAKGGVAPSAETLKRMDSQMECKHLRVSNNHSIHYL